MKTCSMLLIIKKMHNRTTISTILRGLKYTHEIKRCLFLGRKVMTNLDSILKGRDITLPTKVQLVKAMFFPVVCMDVSIGL